MSRPAARAITLFILAALLAFAPAARAETLVEFEQNVAKYQSDPVKRAKEISEEIKHMMDIEEGLARQNGISVTRVISYEDVCNDIINLYYSTYYLQKHRSNMSSFQLDDTRIRALAASTPPYSFVYYLSVVEDVDSCREEVKTQNGIYDRAKQAVLEADAMKASLEKQYRACATRVADRHDVSPTLNWELQETKIKLEYAIAQKNFYTLSQSLAGTDMLTAREQYDTMCSMLAGIRKHVTFSEEDFTLLDAYVSKRANPLVETVQMLDSKFATLERLYGDTDNSAFTKFWLKTEQSLVEDEALLLEDMIDGWNSLRLVWRTLEDVIENRLTLEEKKQSLQHFTAAIDDVDGLTAVCARQLQVIYRVEHEIERRFTGDEARMSESDKLQRDSFLENLSARKQRYLAYIIDAEAAKSQYEQLTNEIRLISEGENLDATTTAESISEHAHKLADYEIWYAGDFPLTLGGLFHALLIFLAIIIATQAVCYFAKRRAASRMNPHGVLLLRKIIAYTGFLVAALCALMSLRIPLTAFAVFGGAIAIAFGFGAQKITGDIFAGIMLLFRKKLRVGDDVIIDGQRGVVREITLQDTVLLCEQSKYLIIPNSRVQESSVVNLTLGDPATRTELTVGIAYESDMERAMGIMRRVLGDEREVLKSPPFKILMEEFGDSSVTLTAQFFVNIATTLERDVKSRLRQKILEAFAQNGVAIPYPQADVRMISKR